MGLAEMFGAGGASDALTNAAIKQVRKLFEPAFNAAVIDMRRDLLARVTGNCPEQLYEPIVRAFRAEGFDVGLDEVPTIWRAMVRALADGPAPEAAGSLPELDERRAIAS